MSWSNLFVASWSARSATALTHDPDRSSTEGTALKFLVYDGQGFWLFQKRFSKGRLQWWPRHTTDGVAALPAEQLAVLIYNGLPLRAGMAEAWRRVS